jgi:hypothetical protein
MRPVQAEPANQSAAFNQLANAVTDFDAVDADDPLAVPRQADARELQPAKERPFE